MIRAFRLWLARTKLRMVEHDIRHTSSDLADAVLAGDNGTAYAMRTYLRQLGQEKHRLTVRIAGLQRE